MNGYPDDIILYPGEVSKRREIAAAVAAAYRELAHVCGIFSWGSTAAGDADSSSDVDIGVYLSGPIPSREARRLAARALADDPAAMSFGGLTGLEGCEKFWVSGVPVFVGWWSLEKDRRFLERKLRSLPKTLDDAKAENELGEVQRTLLLWDPQGSQADLKRIVGSWFETKGKEELVSKRLTRAEYEITNHLPRALGRGDAAWAEESRRNALNELIRIVYYLNNRFLRRLKSVDLELQAFRIKPSDFVSRIRRAAISDPRAALPILTDLLADVRILSAG